MKRKEKAAAPLATVATADSITQANPTGTIVARLIAEYKQTAIRASRRARVEPVALFAAQYRRIADEARDAARRLEASI